MSDPPVTTAADAVHPLYVAHAADIHRFAARRIGRDLADDIVADTFRHAIESWAAFDADRGSARGGTPGNRRVFIGS